MSRAGRPATVLFGRDEWIQWHDAVEVPAHADLEEERDVARRDSRWPVESAGQLDARGFARES